MHLNLWQYINTIKQQYLGSKLLKSGTWYTVSTFIQRGLAFLGVMIFTRLLTEAEYGTVVIFGSWMAMLSPFITLNMASSVQIARHEFEDEAYQDFLTSITALGLFVGGLLFVALLLLPGTFLQQITNVERIILLLAVFIGLMQLPMQVIFNVWRVEFQYIRYVVGSTAYALLRLLLPAILIVWAFLPFETPLRYIIGFGGAVVLISSYATYQILRNSHRLIDFSSWRFALFYALPLIPHVLTGIILSHFDRVLIDQYIGRSETGLYTLAYQIGEVIQMLWYASNSAWVPWFYEKMANKNYTIIYQRARQYLWAFTALTLLTIFCAPLLIRIIAPPEYYVAGAVVPIVMGSIFFNLPYSLYANVEFYQKRTVYISIGTAIAAVINIVLNILLLPQFGYIAAAWTTMISYICLFAFHTFTVRDIIRAEVRLPLGWMLACSTLVILAAVAISTLLTVV